MIRDLILGNGVVGKIAHAGIQPRGNQGSVLVIFRYRGKEILTKEILTAATKSQPTSYLARVGSCGAPPDSRWTRRWSRHNTPVMDRRMGEDVPTQFRCKGMAGILRCSTRRTISGVVRSAFFDKADDAASPFVEAIEIVTGREPQDANIGASNLQPEERL
jgi:hypothetical protein